MFETNIQSLLPNLTPLNKPIELDIVLEGGGFNGSYESGVLYFLKELEKKNYITVDKISGVSVGSILGICFLTNTLDSFVTYYKQARTYWKEKINLLFYKKIITKIITDIPDKLFESIKKNKMYITYFNLLEKKQVLVSTYDTKQELIDTVWKSSYIPYITDNNICCEMNDQFFIDGGQPHIFNNRNCHDKKILYVTINHFSKLTNMLTIKNEINANGRILEGILDCYNFFLHEKSTFLCSYVNTWSFFDFLKIRIKHLLLLLIIYVIYYIYIIHYYLNPYLKNSIFYNQTKGIFYNMYKDFLIKYCF